MTHLFPRYHLRPPRGFINDPNGPVTIGDTVHLYFQSRPTADTAAPVQWGHATSSDFVRWALHRPAMSPQPNGPDRDGCFSGNTVATEEGIRAFYSGHIEGKHYQSVLSAVSRDGGFSFGAPVELLPDPTPAEQVVMFRDPFVWKAGRVWRMVVGAEVKGEVAAVRLYESLDLDAWVYLGHLVEMARTTQAGVDTGAGWECPQVVTLDGEDVAIVSAWSQAGLSGEVLSLRDGRARRLDWGTNFYAASAMRNTSHGELIFGWVTEGADTSMWLERGWAGAISLPRVVSPGYDSDLLSDPIPTLQSLRTGEEVGTELMSTTSAFELRLPHEAGRTRIWFGSDEWLDLTIDLNAGTLSIDRDHASRDPRAHRGIATATNAFAANRRRDAVRLFVDGSIVEAFTSAGRVLTTRIYPTTPPPWSVEAPSGAIMHTLSADAYVQAEDQHN